MPKIVRMIAQVDVEKCTGCDLCNRVCPTAAFTLRPRRPDEPGKSKRVVELIDNACLNAQRCIELCPDDALTMIELDEPFEVGVDPSQADQEKIKELCAKAGYPPELQPCVCTKTSMAEMAAAILLGADTMEKVSLATGARTGCSELCMHPMLRLLEGAGYGDAPKVNRGYQWYPSTTTLFEHANADGTFPAELTEAYPGYPINSELVDLIRTMESGK